MYHHCQQQSPFSIHFINLLLLLLPSADCVRFMKLYYWVLQNISSNHSEKESIFRQEFVFKVGHRPLELQDDHYSMSLSIEVSPGSQPRTSI